MGPQQVRFIGSNRVEQFMWNGKWVVYVNNKRIDGTFEEICQKLSSDRNSSTTPHITMEKRDEDGN